MHQTFEERSRQNLALSGACKCGTDIEEQELQSLRKLSRAPPLWVRRWTAMPAVVWQPWRGQERHLAVLRIARRWEYNSHIVLCGRTLGTSMPTIRCLILFVRNAWQHKQGGRNLLPCRWRQVPRCGRQPNTRAVLFA